MRTITTIGLDIAKSVFRVHGCRRPQLDYRAFSAVGQFQREFQITRARLPMRVASVTATMPIGCERMLDAGDWMIVGNDFLIKSSVFIGIIENAYNRFCGQSMTDRILA